MELPVWMEIRGRRKGYVARVYQGQGVKYRIDAREDKSIKRDEWATLEVMKKIILRGREGKISAELERKIRDIIKEEKRIFSREEKWELAEQWLDGAPRENLGGMSAEEYAYQKVIVPEVMRNGGKQGDVVPQMRMKDLLYSGAREGDERRVDFSVKIGRETVVIEIDDATHKGREMKDTARDEELRKNMVSIVRVNDENLGASGDQILQKMLRSVYKKHESERRVVTKQGVIRLRQMTIEVQVAMLTALERGCTGKIYVGDGCFPDVEPRVKDKICEAALDDLRELERNIAEIYGEEMRLSQVKYDAQAKTVIDLNAREGKETVMLEEIGVNRDVVNHRNRNVKYGKLNPRKENLEYLLRYIYRHKEFRPNQVDGIQRILMGDDTIVLLPTGSGKSVIYQMIAMILPGTSLVIEPLKSLMDDQIANLRRSGIDAVGNFSGELRGEEKQKAMELLMSGVYDMVYVTPERLQLNEFRKTLDNAKRNGVIIPMCALDEAHCVSEWGHDFRVAYLNIAETCRKVCKVGDKVPAILALTGTASDNVLKDMERDLGIDEGGVIRPASFDRPEIHYKVFAVESGEKMAALRWLLDKEIPKDFGCENVEELLALKGEETKAGIIFCVYKSGKTDFGVDAVYEELNKCGYPGLTRYYATNTEADKVRANAEDYKENRASLMVATKAFGMGIDKPNIRFTIHFGIPSSIEAFYQEAGRAGRDGQRSMSYVILSNDAPERNGQLIKQTDVDDLRKNLKKIGTKKSDDVNRLLFLHQMNYDKRQTMNDMEAILMLMGGMKEKKVNIVATSDLEFSRWQKVFYRMKILEMLDDYTIVSYANNEFALRINDFQPARVIEAYKRYIRQYQEGQVDSEMAKLRGMKFASRHEFVMEMMESLLEFVNNIFESSRRRAIGNMLQLAEEVVEVPVAKQDEMMRKKILGHLGNTYKEVLTEIIKNVNGVEEAVRAVKMSRGQTEAVLLMEARRALQTYPEHPGLLLVTGFLGAIDEETNPIVAVEDVTSAMENAREKYGIARGTMENAVRDLIEIAAERARDERKMLQFLERFVSEMPKKYSQSIMEVLPEKYAEGFLMEKMEGEMIKVLEKIKEENLWTKEV